jgi:hypothetical protein
MNTNNIKKMLQLSDIKCIGKARTNPLADEAERISEEYCRVLGLKTSGYKGINTMCRYLHPDANLERLVALNMFYNLLWYMDDTLISAQERSIDENDVWLQNLYRNCAPILLSGTMPEEDHVLYTGCLKLRELFVKLCPEWWMKKLVKSVSTHLHSTTLSINEIMVDGKPDVEKFLKLREIDSAMPLTIDMIFLEMDIFLKDEVLNDPIISQLTAITSLYGFLTNELMSYHKEVILAGSRFNLINVLMEARNFTFEEAVHEAVVLINSKVESFLEYEKKIPDFDDAEINRQVKLYVQGLRNEFLGSWHWQWTTNRYRSVDSPFPELRIMLE